VRQTKGSGGKSNPFSSFKRQYLENDYIKIRSKLLLMAIRKSHSALSIDTNVDHLG